MTRRIITIELDADELENVVYEMEQNHGPRDFESECPGCSAYRKLKEAHERPHGVLALGAAHLTVQECDVANRLLDTVMREAHDTTVWPKHWMAVRAQLIAAIRTAGVAMPDGGQPK